MIFDKQLSRKPNRYPWTQQFINAMWAGFWTPNEFNFAADVQEFHTVLSKDEREVIVRTLSAIAQIEVAVKQFWANMGRVLPQPGIVDLGIVMAHVEVIHNLAYEKLLDVLGLNRVFEQNMKLPVIRGRVDYLNKHLEKRFEDDRKQYVYALILFTLFVENVSLFSQFYIISWFNRYRNALKDTAQQVQYTAKEEQIHALVGIQIINTIRKECPDLFDAELEALVQREAEAAFTAECAIIDWIIGDYSGTKIDATILKNYVASRINESFTQIGFAAPLDEDESLTEKTLWMQEEVLGNAMTDFFHKKPTEYAKKNKTFNEEDLF